MAAFAMTQACPTIYLIDDDDSVRRALGRVMASSGFAWQAFHSVDDFMATPRSAGPGCIVADVTMPGMNGIDLKRMLNAAHEELPVIFLTAQDTETMRTAAKDAGVAGFFRKPVDTQALLDAIQWALKAQPTTPPSA